MSCILPYISSINLSSVPVSGAQFDLATAALGGYALYQKWGSSEGVSSILFTGMQGFLLASLAERSLRILLSKDVKNRSEGKAAIAIPVLEEAVYSGILRTTSFWGVIPRFATTLIVSYTAARGVLNQAVRVSERSTTDIKLGLWFAIFREILLQSLKEHLSLPLLVLADSAIFGLCEVCPVKDDPNPIPRYSSAWFFRVFSAAAFRSIANVTTLRAGMSAAIVQHMLFNVSRALKG